LFSNQIHYNYEVINKNNLMSENYNFSDFVKFRKGSTFGIGKIENFSREEDWFEYFEYILSEELPTGWFIYCILYCI